MDISREQFIVLEAIATNTNLLSPQGISSIYGQRLDETYKIITELAELGYVANNAITDAGLSALEPYRCKRAIFMAAGLGTRLHPITLNTPKPLVRVHGARIIDRLIDACLLANIREIYIVRGYLAEQFDGLLYKYPMIKFLENPMYNEANNISSSLVARNYLSNSYVFEADLWLYNFSIIKKYHYKSNFLAIKKVCSDDWCFKVKDNVIIEETIGGEGDDIWQMVGISYWNGEDGRKLSNDIAEIYSRPGGKARYWEQVPLVYKNNQYQVEIRPCDEKDVIEIDSYNDLKLIDKAYEV